MKRLKSFAGFVAESVTPDEIITTGAHDKLDNKGTNDKKLDKAAAEGEASAKIAKADDEAAKKAASSTDAEKVDPKAPAAQKSNRKLVRGGTEAVAQWQEKLVKAGYKIDVDGAWGKNTQAAYVKYIEKKYGADSPKAKKVQGGVAPAVAKESPGGSVWKFAKAAVVGLATAAVLPIAAPYAAVSTYMSK